MTVHLILGGFGALAFAQALLVILARGLKLRLHRHAILAAWGLAAGLVIWFAVSDHVLFPTQVLSRAVPGAPSSTMAENHNILNDAVYQFIPWESEVRRALGAGRLPLWSDRLDGGSSPWVNPQAGVLSPVAVLARLVPLRHHLLVALALKIMIAFQGAWLLARLLGSRRFLCLFAGAAFALGGGIMAWSLFPHSASAAWMPWLAVGSIRVARRRWPRAIAATAFITCAMLLSGHPETALGGGLLAVVCATCFARRSHGLPGFVRGLAAASVAAVVGFGLAAPHLAPFAKHLPHTVRYQRMSDATEDASGGLGTMLNARRAHLLKGAVNPHAFGRAPYSGRGFVPVGGGGYAGVLALAGAVLAIALRVRRCWPFLVVAGAVGLMIAEFLPLALIVSRLPVVETVEWTRLITTIPLCIAVAGAVGLSELHRRRSTLASITVLITATASLWISPRPYVVILWVGTVAAVALTVWRPRVGMLGLVMVVIADLGPWSTAMLPRGDPELFYPETGFISRLVAEVDGRGGCRVVGHARNLYPSLLSRYGIDDVRYHNPVADYAYAQFLDRVFGFHPEARPYEYTSPIRRLPNQLDFLNVGFVVSGTRKVPKRFERVFSEANGPRTVYRSRRVIPRAFVPADISVVEPSQILSAVVSNTDPRVVVVSDRDSKPVTLPSPPQWRLKSVRSITDTMGRVALEIRPEGDVLVATSLTHPRGWTASADGRELSTVTVNHAFTGVVVPADARDVVLEFVPPGFHTGFVLFFAALAVTGVLFFRRR
jgi:hypothetical protein